MAGPTAFFTWIRDKLVQLVLPLMPKSLYEILLFIVMVVLIIVIVDLLVYTNIQKRIRNDSRCYQENKENQRSYGDYVAFVKTKDGDLVGTVLYDAISGDTRFQDNCIQQLKSDDDNSIRVNVPVYTMINGSSKLVEYTAECPNAIGGAAKAAGLDYTGHPDYVKFVQDGTKPPTR